MTTSVWEARAPKEGDVAPDPELLDEAGKPLELSMLRGPLVVLFLPWPVDAMATRVLRDYRDSTMLVERAGARVVAISAAEPSTLAFLRTERGLGFRVLSDADATASALWGMTGQLGLFVLDRNHVVRLRELGERATAASVLTFLRRGGARASRSPGRLLDQVALALSRVRNALHLGRPSARAVR